MTKLTKIAMALLLMTALGSTVFAQTAGGTGDQGTTTTTKTKKHHGHKGGKKSKKGGTTTTPPPK